jgi:hypothetical protein
MLTLEMSEADRKPLKALIGGFSAPCAPFRTLAWLILILLPTLAFTFPVETDRRALSASFGEYRPGRLHAGVDFATFGKVGLPIRAIAAGRVIRVRSSAGGYGNVVYLQHEDGRRSVYAHLDRFAPRIAAQLPRSAHRLGGDSSAGTMEVFPPRTLNVREGEVIGWSGESGAGLPHFHFELRDASDRPINPVEAGALSPRDRVSPVITGIIIEPADTASDVDGGGLPVILDAATPQTPGASRTLEASRTPNTSRTQSIRATGRVRILVSAYDEDGRLGGKLGITRARLLVDGVEWSQIRMSSFTYGKDREAPLVYDFYRTGFSPTRYTYDLTAPAGAAESVRGRGVFEIRGEHKIRVLVEDMSGNRAATEFILGATTTRGARRTMTGDGEYISLGGLVIRRGGAEERFVSGNHVVSGLDCRATKISPLAGLFSDEILDGVRVRGVEAGTSVYAARGGRLPAASGAAGPVILVGPYGLALGTGAEISVRIDGAAGAVGAANGLAQWTNDTWHWVGGSVSGGNITARIAILAPVVPIRDAIGPSLEFVDDERGRRIEIRDAESGIDGESVRVTEEAEGRERRVIEGRFDADRDAFLPDEPLPAAPRTWVIEAADRVGNRTRRSFAVSIAASPKRGAGETVPAAAGARK